jgi:hypothetical protein
MTHLVDNAVSSTPRVAGRAAPRLGDAVELVEEQHARRRRPAKSRNINSSSVHIPNNKFSLLYNQYLNYLYLNNILMQPVQRKPAGIINDDHRA